MEVPAGVLSEKFARASSVEGPDCVFEDFNGNDKAFLLHKEKVWQDNRFCDVIFVVGGENVSTSTKTETLFWHFRHWAHRRFWKILKGRYVHSNVSDDTQHNSGVIIPPKTAATFSLIRMPTSKLYVIIPLPFRHRKREQLAPQTQLST